MPNFDEKTGIRYGVISPHSVGQWAMERIYDHGTDPHYESARDEITKALNTVFELSGIFNEEKQNDIRDEILDHFNDHYENPDGQMDYSDSEYDLHVSGDNFGIFVMRSPYYTYCRGCSPCAPGAGDLDSPIEKDPDYPLSGVTLCLGPEWFDTDDDQYSRKMPYKCYRVDNDQEVI